MLLIEKASASRRSCCRSLLSRSAPARLGEIWLGWPVAKTKVLNVFEEMFSEGDVNNLDTFRSSLRKHKDAHVVHPKIRQLLDGGSEAVFGCSVIACGQSAQRCRRTSERCPRCPAEGDVNNLDIFRFPLRKRKGAHVVQVVHQEFIRVSMTTLRTSSGFQLLQARIRREVSDRFGKVFKVSNRG